MLVVFAKNYKGHKIYNSLEVGDFLRSILSCHLCYFIALSIDLNANNQI